LNEALLDFSELPGQSRGAEDLAPVVFRVLEDFGIMDKLYCITSDSASNNLTMSAGLSRLMKEKYNIDWDHETRHIPCLAHVIHNVVKTFLRSIKASASEPGEDSAPNPAFECSLILEKVRTLSKKISGAWAQFVSICQSYDIAPLKIYLDCTTRWGSTHRMIERILVMKKAVSRFAQDREDCEDYWITSPEWDLLELICAFLWPFRWATEAIESTTKPEIDRVFYIYNALFDRMDDLKTTLESRHGRRQTYSADLITALEYMRLHLAKYYKKTKKPGVYSDSMILHPRIKLQLFRTQTWATTDADKYAKQCRERYDRDYASLEGVTDQATYTGLPHKRKSKDLDDDDMAYEAFMQSLEDTTPDTSHELERYLNKPREPGVVCALDWWRVHHREYPRLARMARDVFSVPPSGAGVEREFSIAGRVATWQRSRLHASTITAIMMYKNYLKRINRPVLVDMDLVEAIGIESEGMDMESETQEEAEVADLTLKDWRKGWKDRLNGVTGTRI
jgi:hypothetical protein